MFILKFNGLLFLLEVNIYYLIIIFIFYSSLLTNYLTLILFNLYILIKNNISLFNGINWTNVSIFSLSSVNTNINKFNLKRMYYNFLILILVYLAMFFYYYKLIIS